MFRRQVQREGWPENPSSPDPAQVMPWLGTSIWHPSWGHLFGCIPGSVLGVIEHFLMLESFQSEPLGITVL